MNFPLLKTIQVDLETIDFLNRKRQQYFKECPTIPAENNVYMSDTGQFTHNLAYWKDIEYIKFVDNILLLSIPLFLQVLMRLPLQQKVADHNILLYFLEKYNFHHFTHRNALKPI